MTIIPLRFCGVDHKARKRVITIGLEGKKEGI
jgi:hypothetical protein